MTELLNRWIVPLEKRYDFLNIAQRQEDPGAVRSDHRLLDEPRTERPGRRRVLCGAFLQDQGEDPTREEFHALFHRLSPSLGFRYDKAAVDYLIDTHYTPVNRPVPLVPAARPAAAGPELLLVPRPPESHDAASVRFAVENYFSIM